MSPGWSLLTAAWMVAIGLAAVSGSASLPLGATKRSAARARSAEASTATARAANVVFTGNVSLLLVVAWKLDDHADVCGSAVGVLAAGQVFRVSWQRGAPRNAPGRCCKGCRFAASRWLESLCGDTKAGDFAVLLRDVLHEWGLPAKIFLPGLSSVVPKLAISQNGGTMGTTRFWVGKATSDGRNEALPVSCACGQ